MANAEWTVHNTILEIEILGSHAASRLMGFIRHSELAEYMSHRFHVSNPTAAQRVAFVTENIAPITDVIVRKHQQGLSRVRTHQSADVNVVDINYAELRNGPQMSFMAGTSQAGWSDRSEPHANWRP